MAEVKLDRVVQAAIAATLLAMTMHPATAQVFLPPPVDPNLYPPALPPRKGVPPPRLDFSLRGEIPLPGPLPGAPPRLVEGGVEIPLQEAVALAEPVPGSVPKIEPRTPGPPPEGALPSVWLVLPSGAYRYRTLPEGRLVAEKRSSLSRSGWRSAWSLRVAGATLAPPLVLDRRVCYASLAGEVICVRADNGHRLWATDVKDRVSRPLALWTGHFEVQAEGKPVEVIDRLILVVPDGGDALIALDPYDGSRRAVYELKDGTGKLASEPLVTGDGTVVVTRQGYTPSEASLSLLGIVPSEKPSPPPKAGVPYNDGGRPTAGSSSP